MQRSDILIEHIAELHQLMEGDTLSEKAKLRLRCILQYLNSDTSMAETAAQFGMTANALHRWLNQFDPNDLSTLEEKSHRPHALRTSQISAHVAALIRQYRLASPKMGKQEIAERLLHDHGIQSSASAIGRVIEQQCLYFANSPLHKRKRLKARMAMPSASLVLAPTQIKPTWFVRSLIVTALLLFVIGGYSVLTSSSTISRLVNVTSSLLHLATSYEP